MDTDLALFTEQRAQELRLTYSKYLSPRRLLARVLDVEQRTVDKLTQAGAMVPCFGQSFAGPRDASCAVCQLQATCLTRTTADVLPQTEALVGQNAVAIAEALDVPLQAATLMQGFKEALQKGDNTEFVDEPLLRFGQERRPVIDVGAHRIASKRPYVGTVAGCMLGAQAAETAWPPLPETTSYRLGNGLKDTHTIQKLRQVPQRLAYGSPVWRKRVQADRKRNPELSWLPEGSILRRTEKGELIDLYVYRDRLTWRGQTFATLYEVLAAIRGRQEYRMQARRGRPQGHGTRTTPDTSAGKYFKACLNAVRLRAQALIHLRKAHPGYVEPLPPRGFFWCPVCQVPFAEGNGMPPKPPLARSLPEPSKLAIQQGQPK